MVQAVEISERGMTVSALANHQLCLLFHPVGCKGITVFGGWDLDWRPVSGRTQCGGGRLEVVDDHASYAGRQHKHPLSRSGRILCMVSELFDRVGQQLPTTNVFRATIWSNCGK